tara:strand:- start:929 stop:1054 length:126 start_codon:yes stop_codon:yes gene_type:complete
MPDNATFNLLHLSGSAALAEVFVLASAYGFPDYATPQTLLN